MAARQEALRSAKPPIAPTPSVSAINFAEQAHTLMSERKQSTNPKDKDYLQNYKATLLEVSSQSTPASPKSSATLMAEFAHELMAARGQSTNPTSPDYLDHYRQALMEITPK